jgi:hypothetical protein
VCASGSTLADARPNPSSACHRTHLGHGRADGSKERLRARVTLVLVLSSSRSDPGWYGRVSTVSEDELCSLPDLGDVRLSSEVLLHIAYEVVSQLDRADEFRLLSHDKLELRDFLEDQIASLQLVVEVQNAAGPFVAQDPHTLAQDPPPPQLSASSINICAAPISRLPLPPV